MYMYIYREREFKLIYNKLNVIFEDISIKIYLNWKKKILIKNT